MGRTQLGSMKRKEPGMLLRWWAAILKGPYTLSWPARCWLPVKGATFAHAASRGRQPGRAKMSSWQAYPYALLFSCVMCASPSRRRQMCVRPRAPTSCAGRPSPPPGTPHASAALPPAPCPAAGTTTPPCAAALPCAAQPPTPARHQTHACVCALF